MPDAEREQPPFALIHSPTGETGWRAFMQAFKTI
jgi:hypothetical protein